MALLLISSSCLSDQGAIVIVNVIVIVIVIEQDCSGDLALYHWNSVQRLQGRPVGQQVICIQPSFVFWKTVQLNKEMKRWLDNFPAFSICCQIWPDWCWRQSPANHEKVVMIIRNTSQKIIWNTSPTSLIIGSGAFNLLVISAIRWEISIFLNHHHLHLFENLLTLVLTFQRCCHPWGWNSPS